jgi:glycosyltransferase involved in cell wall biosynthesis
MAGVLYISYDGVLEPLGQSQVLAYLKQLSAVQPIHLLSYEKTQDWANEREVGRLRREMESVGIRWHPVRYHKAPSALATSWDIAAGIVLGMYLILRHDLKIVHARSYVASVVALTLRNITSVRYLFDMRGFWADERVDGGLWQRDSGLYRTAKWFERRFLLRADHVVCLTHASVRELRKFDYLRDRAPPMTVIPTCADLERFRPPESKSAEFVLGYVGSAGTWYEFDAAAVAFAALKRHRPEARMLIINRDEHEYIRHCLDKAGISPQHVELLSAPYADVPHHMARMTAGAFFIKPLFSKQASAPTKLGEFLGCGIPCLSNHGVGDMASILEGNRVGVAVQSFSATEIDSGVKRLLALTDEKETSDRCVRIANEHFQLAEGVRRYARVYEQLLGAA